MSAPGTAQVHYLRPSEALGIKPVSRMADGTCWFDCHDVASALRVAYGVAFNGKNHLTRYLRTHRLRRLHKIVRDYGETEHWVLNEAGLVAAIMFIDCEVSRDFRMAVIPDIAERGIREDDAAVARPF